MEELGKWEAFAKRLCFFYHRRNPSVCEVEDLHSIAYLAVVEALRTSSEEPFVACVVRRRLIDYLRTLSWAKRHVSHKIAASGRPYAIQQPFTDLRQSLFGEHAVEEQDFMELLSPNTFLDPTGECDLRECFDHLTLELTPKERLIARLAWLDERPIAYIAEQLHVSEDRIHQMLRSMRERMLKRAPHGRTLQLRRQQRNLDSA